MGRNRRQYTILQKDDPIKPETVLVVKNGKRYVGVEAQLADDLRKQVEDLTPAERAEIRRHFSKRAGAGTTGKAIEFVKADGSSNVVGDGAVTRLDLSPREPGAVEKRTSRAEYLDDAIGDGTGSGASVERL